MRLLPGLSPVWIAAFVAGAHAYIPARPTNDTSQVSLSEDFIQVSHGIPGSSSLSFFRSNVSRQLFADNSTQVGNQYAARGALVHFSETNATQTPGSAPWIAYINCDRNESDASMIDDIFTLTRDHGAVAALLYTETSEACLINDDYIENFEKPIDVYATTKKQAARLISSPFLSADQDVFWFDSQRLNDSAAGIWDQLNQTISLKPGVEDTSSSPSQDPDATSSTITLLQPNSTAVSGDEPSNSAAASQPNDGQPTSNTPSATIEVTGRLNTADNTFDKRDHWRPTPMPLQRRAASSTDLYNGPTSFSSAQPSSAPGSGYLIAVLANQKAVFASSSDSGSGDGDGSDNGDDDNSRGSKLTGLAMIILYAITGAVTLLFVIVIVNGAIKAIRHPERYGPRAQHLGHGGAPQGRARGISRAILDGFPVIKFGREESQADLANKSQVQEYGLRDLEAAPGAPDHERADQTDTSNSDRRDAPATAATAVTDAAQGRGDQGAEQPCGDNQPRSTSPNEATNPAPQSAVAAATATDASCEATDDPNDVNHVQTCPICVCDFEADEELRVLPCAGRHRFHKDCIDPWLLDVSSLCPLCRWDVAQDAEDTGAIEEEEEDQEAGGQGSEGRRHRRGTFGNRARRVLSASAASSRRIANFGQHSREGTGDTAGSGFSRNRFRTYLEHIRQGTRAHRHQNATAAAQDLRQEPPSSSTQ